MFCRISDGHAARYTRERSWPPMFWNCAIVSSHDSKFCPAPSFRIFGFNSARICRTGFRNHKTLAAPSQQYVSCFSGTLATKKQLSAATMRSYSAYMLEKSPAETMSGTASSDDNFTASAGLALEMGLLSAPSSSPTAMLGEMGDATKLLLASRLTRRTAECRLARDGTLAVGNTLSSARSKYASRVYVTQHLKLKSYLSKEEIVLLVTSKSLDWSGAGAVNFVGLVRNLFLSSGGTKPMKTVQK